MTWHKKDWDRTPEGKAHYITVGRWQNYMFTEKKLALIDNADLAVSTWLAFPFAKLTIPKKLRKKSYIC